MTDPDDPLRFTPVPLQRRARGWTPDAQLAFIDALSRTGVVAHAARSVGCSPRSAYQLRKRDGADSFAAAWDWALEMGLDAARNRAMGIIHGDEVRPLVRNGRIVGHRSGHDHRLLLAALRSLDPAFARTRDTMPHRERIAGRLFMEQLTDHGPPNPVDWEAVDLPWFDRSSIERGPDAVDAACRAARAMQDQERRNAPPPAAPAVRTGPHMRLL